MREVITLKPSFSELEFFRAITWLHLISSILV